MDYAIMVSDYLNANGIVSYLDVPPNRPDEFCVVELTGFTAENVVLRRPSVDIDCWAKTRKRAASIASDVVDAVFGMADDLPNVFDVAITSKYNNPDMDSGSPRYTVGVSVIANE